MSRDRVVELLEDVTSELSLIRLELKALNEELRKRMKE